MSELANAESLEAVVVPQEPELLTVEVTPTIEPPDILEDPAALFQEVINGSCEIIEPLDPESTENSQDADLQNAETAEDKTEELELSSLDDSKFDALCESNEDTNTPKTNRELKSILELSKEAKLDTNITQRRKTADKVKRTPKKTKLTGFPVTAESELENFDVKIEEKKLVKKRKTSISIESGAEGATSEDAKRAVQAISGDFVMVRKPNKDIFCWRCHHDNVQVACETCPRAYHLRCLKQTITDLEHWPCPECVAILKAENTQSRSKAMKGMSLEHLCSLLKFAVKRMIQCNGSEPFIHPVDEKQFPEYKNYIVQPMTLTTLEKNIKENAYGSTQAFEADAKWILHNSIIFNSYQSKLTTAAKAIVKICKQEMAEVENCPSCYLNANTKKHTWFIEVCPRPHLLVWAKLKGFPYWPAKVMSINNQGMADVRFFGAHDKAWVSVKECYLYSVKDPNSGKQKRNDIIECVKELELYVDNLREIYGRVNFAPFKTPLEDDCSLRQLQVFLPNYRDGKETVRRGKEMSRVDGSFRKSLSSGENLEESEEEKSEESSEDDEIEEEEEEDEEEEEEEEDIRRLRKKEDKSNGEKHKEGMTRIDYRDGPSGKTNVSPKPIKILIRKRYSTEGFQENIAKLPRRDSDKGETNNKPTDNRDNSPEKINTDQEEISPNKISPMKLRISDQLIKKLEEISDPDKEKENEEEGKIEKKIDEDENKDKKVLLSKKNDQEEMKRGEDLKEVLIQKEEKVYIESKGKEESVEKAEEKKQENESVVQDKSVETFSRAVGNENDTNKETKGEDVQLRQVSSEESTSSEKEEKVMEEPKKFEETENKIEEAKKKTEEQKRKIDESKKKAEEVKKKIDEQKKKVDDHKSKTEGTKKIDDSRKETSKKRKYEEAKDKNSKNQGENNLFPPNKMVKLVPIENILQKKDLTNETPSATKEQLIVLKEIRVVKDGKETKMKTKKAEDQDKTNEKEGPVKIKREVESDEDTDVQYMEAKRQYLSALNISEKQKVPVKPKGHEIRTRSKTEEKKTKNVETPKLNEEQKDNSHLGTKSAEPVKEIYIKSLAKMQTPKAKARKSFPTPNYSKKTVVARKIVPKTALDDEITIVNTATLQPTANVMILPKLHYSKGRDIGSPPVLTMLPRPAQVDNSTSISKKIPDGSQNYIPQNEDEEKNRSSNSGILLNNLLSAAGTSQQPPPPPVIDVDSQSNPGDVELGPLKDILPENVTKGVHEIFQAPPKLKPKPVGLLNSVTEPGVPSTAGPVASKINSMAQKLSDYFRSLLVETISDLGKSNNAEATISGLKYEIEELNHKHSVELAEIRRNVSIVLKDIQKSVVEERERIINETKANCEMEMMKRVEEAKSKQWCANCSKEAQFYCCWNTSYCDYPCQQKHWPKHMSKCTQTASQNQQANNTSTPVRTSGQQLVLTPTAAPKFGALFAKPQKVYLKRTNTTTFKPATGSHITLVESTPGNFELLGSGPIAVNGKILASTSVIEKIKSGNIVTVTAPSGATNTQLTSANQKVNTLPKSTASSSDSEH